MMSDGTESVTVRLQRTPDPAGQRLIYSLTDEFDPENISRLWRMYDADWHHQPGERFLTRKEFTGLLEELQTTKITTIHDEGMRRIKEGEFCFTSLESSSYFTSSCIYSRPNERGSSERRPIGKYNYFPKSLIRFNYISSCEHHLTSPPMVKQNPDTSAPSKARINFIHSSSRDGSISGTSLRKPRHEGPFKFSRRPKSRHAQHHQNPALPNGNRTQAQAIRHTRTIPRPPHDLTATTSDAPAHRLTLAL